MAGFWESAGNWLGNTFGVNQANNAQAANAQAQAGMTGAGQMGATGQAASNQALQGAQASLGANAGQTIQKATTAAMPVASQVAAQTGNVTGRQVGSAARTAGLNKGQAALEAGQAAGTATAATMPGALQNQIGNYMGATGQQIGLQGQTAAQGLQGYGTQAGTGAGYSSDQSKLGQAGAANLGNMVSGAAGGALGLKEGGITEGATLAGEAGPEAVIPIRKLLKIKPRSLEEILTVIRPQIEKTTSAGEGEGPEPTMKDLIARLVAVEEKMK